MIEISEANKDGCQRVSEVGEQTKTFLGYIMKVGKEWVVISKDAKVGRTRLRRDAIKALVRSAEARDD